MKLFHDKVGLAIIAGRPNVYSTPILVLAGTRGISGIVRAVGKIACQISNIPYAALLQAC